MGSAKSKLDKSDKSDKSDKNNYNKNVEQRRYDRAKKEAKDIAYAKLRNQELAYRKVGYFIVQACNVKDDQYIDIASTKNYCISLEKMVQYYKKNGWDVVGNITSEFLSDIDVEYFLYFQPMVYVDKRGESDTDNADNDDSTSSATSYAESSY